MKQIKINYVFLDLGNYRMFIAAKSTSDNVLDKNNLIAQFLFLKLVRNYFDF